MAFLCPDIQEYIHNPIYGLDKKRYGRHTCWESFWQRVINKCKMSSDLIQKSRQTNRFQTWSEKGNRRRQAVTIFSKCAVCPAACSASPSLVVGKKKWEQSTSKSSASVGVASRTMLQTTFSPEIQVGIVGVKRQDGTENVDSSVRGA